MREIGPCEEAQEMPREYSQRGRYEIQQEADSASDFLLFNNRLLFVSSCGCLISSTSLEALMKYSPQA